jgi:hypothetical protein
VLGSNAFQEKLNQMPEAGLRAMERDRITALTSPKEEAELRRTWQPLQWVMLTILRLTRAERAIGDEARNAILEKLDLKET